MNLEDLRLGADVVSADGHKLGKLGHFVIDRDSLRLTQLVIDTGILRSGEALWKGGWGLSHDRIVPIGALASAGPDAVKITMAGDDFLEHSRDYDQEYFEEMPDRVEGWPDLSDVRRLAASFPGEPGPYLMRETNAVPAWQADIPADAPVWRLNPHQKIGEVERVLYDAATKKMTALVIKRGFIFSKEMELPVSHLVEVVGGVVRVEIDDDALGALVEHHAG